VERIAATSRLATALRGGLMAGLIGSPAAAACLLGRAVAGLPAHPAAAEFRCACPPHSACWWVRHLGVARNPPRWLRVWRSRGDALLLVFPVLGACCFGLALQGVKSYACRRLGQRLRRRIRNDLFATPWSSRSAPRPNRGQAAHPLNQLIVDALAEVFGSGGGRVLGDLWSPCGDPPSP